VVYYLYATDGYYELPDGRPLYLYGLIGGREGHDLTYRSGCTPGEDPRTGLPSCTGSANVTVAGGPVAPKAGTWAGQDAQFAGNTQFPAPILYARVGDIVEIHLKNLGPALKPSAPNDPYNVHLRALDIDTASGGLLGTSLEAVPANLCADGTTAGPDGCGAVGAAPDAGRVVVYLFSPSQPGTYLYYGQRDVKGPVTMAMFGALVVYGPDDEAAAAGPGQGLGGTLYDEAYDQDYVLLLSEFQGQDLPSQAGTGLRYGSINGLSFPQTIHAAFPSGYSFADWLAAHPGYETLIAGDEGATGPATGSGGQKVLLRVLNVGMEAHAMHLHSGQGRVIGSDQRGWFWSHNVPFNQSVETETLAIGSGETYDWLVDLHSEVDLGRAVGETAPTLPYVLLYDEAMATDDGVHAEGMFTFVRPVP
jgi:FtsP/CotA-like multicopper oxidase with cupredoxin domain